MFDRMLSMLSLSFVCDSPLKTSRRRQSGGYWENASQVKISAPETKSTAFMYANESI